jgi:hypothetical protein
MGVRTRIAIATLAALFVVALPVAGAAAESRVPPGVSGANQYSETLPGPGGNDRTGGGSGKTPAQAVGKENAAKLEALGPDGRAAAELAAETAPGGGKAAGGHGGAASNGGASGSSSGAGASGSSGLDQVFGQVTGTGGSESGSNGMGLLLPLLIAAAIVAAAAYALNRRRTARPQD